MNDKHYNPAIASRLRTLVDNKRWPDVLSYLSTLSNAHFRTAGYLLGEQFLPSLPQEDFWTLASALVSANSKAFLVTILKGVSSVDGGEAFFSQLKGKDEDVRKSMLTLLPKFSSPEDILRLESWLDVRDPRQRISIYLQCPTMPTAFLLMRALHEVEDDRALLVRTCYFLIKRGDGLSFNLASLLRSIFGLEEVKGTFALQVRSYEISLLSLDFSAFTKALRL